MLTMGCRFSPSTKMQLTDETWKRLLRNVAVEVLALRRAGRNIDQACYPGPNHRGWRSTQDISIAIEDDGVSLIPTRNHAIERVLEGIPKPAQEASQSTAQILLAEAPGAAARSIPQEEDAWMNLPLSDPAIKLTVSCTFPSLLLLTITNTLPDPQTHNPTLRPPAPRCSHLLRTHRRRSLRRLQDQGKAQEAA